MSYFESIILGVIQGITEFLPISSSGHLLLGRSLFNIQIDASGSFIEAFLHGGTLLSILLYWRKELRSDFMDIVNGKSALLLNLIVATFPAALIGLIFKDKINSYFFDINNISYLCVSYSVLAIILYLTKVKINHKNSRIIVSFALFIGFAQCFAIIPGISRSGITIATALLLGINHRDATKFSFLLAIPILLFAFLYSLISNFSLINSEILIQLVMGFFSALIVGYFSIGFLVKLISNHRLWYFSIYCMIISLIIGYQYGI